MMKIRKEVLPLLFCVLWVLLLLPMQATAAGAIDPTQDASLTIRYLHDGTPVPGVSFDLYRVANVDEYAEFTLTGDFRSYPVSVTNLTTDEWKTLAETLTGYADRDKLIPLDSGKTGESGTLLVPCKQTSLKPGLYLVVGRPLALDGYTYTTEPFLVSLPNLDTVSNTWSYDITIAPKYTRSENPIKPDEQTVEQKVLKVWKDDLSGIRPTEAIVQLLRDGEIYDTVTLDDANGWRYTWEALPEYNKDGSKIVWSIVEMELADYTVQVIEDGSTFIVTNTYSPEKPDEGTITRMVQKVWDDKGYESRRPKSVQVTLLQNGIDYDSQELSNTNSWQYTWDSLPQYDEDGREYTWTIREVTVYGYKSAVRQNGSVFVLTNTLDKQKLPQTGVLWWPVALLTCGGLTFLIVGMACRRKDHE